MKNIILVVKHPLVSATYQEVLGLQDHRFLLAASLQEFKTVLEILDPSDPDLIAMASYHSDPLVKGIIEGWPKLQSKMVIMAMDQEADETLVPLVPVPVFLRSNDPESGFFKKCREILGE